MAEKRLPRLHVQFPNVKGLSDAAKDYALIARVSRAMAGTGVSDKMIFEYQKEASKGGNHIDVLLVTQNWVSLY